MLYHSCAKKHVNLRNKRNLYLPFVFCVDVKCGLILNILESWYCTYSTVAFFVLKFQYISCIYCSSILILRTMHYNQYTPYIVMGVCILVDQELLIVIVLEAWYICWHVLLLFLVKRTVYLPEGIFNTFSWFILSVLASLWAVIFS